MAVSGHASSRMVAKGAGVTKTGVNKELEQYSINFKYEKGRPRLSPWPPRYFYFGHCGTFLGGSYLMPTSDSLGIGFPSESKAQRNFPLRSFQTLGLER